MLRICVRKLHTIPKCDFQPQPYTNKSYDAIHSIRKTVLNPSIIQYYQKPLLIHQGYKQWLFDENNRRYLDLIGGIVTISIGHCHPRTNEALKKQADKLWHTTNIYMHPQVHQYAEELIAKFPEPLKVVYFVNSGSEANDFAFLLAKLYTGNNDIITLRNSYHGMSAFGMGATNLGTWRFNSGTYNGFVPTMNADPYRGPWGGSACRDSPVQTLRKCNCKSGECQASDKYLQQLKDVLQFSTPKAGIAGMICESIQGIGGTVQFPRNFLRGAFELIRSHNGICISDEVQTGFGRIGSHYWGFQSHDVVPDIVTMAKGIGNGFPLGAVVTTPEVGACLNKLGTTFNTFGGNPLGMAVAREVLKVIDEEELQKNALITGTYFLEKLGQLRDKYEIIGDVRGKGLMIGMEMVEDRIHHKPLNGEKMNTIWEMIKDEGVLIGKGGLFGNVFRIKPPMCITQEDVDFTLYVFEKVLSKI